MTMPCFPPYADRVRYRVEWRSPEGRVFIGLGTLAPEMHPPPGSSGAVPGCCCPGAEDPEREPGWEEEPRADEDRPLMLRLALTLRSLPLLL